MKLAVIGASGFVGRHVLAAARREGHEVIGTQSRPVDPGLAVFDLHRDRLSDRLPASFRGDAEQAWCVVCAAVVPMDRCSADPAYSRSVMVDGTTRLMDDARDRGVRSLFISSGFVFDGLEGYYRESHPRNPINSYGRYKAEVEEYLERSVPEALVLRLDKVVGDDPAERHLFSEWQECALAGRPIACIEGQLFAPTLVDDIARAVMLGCREGLAGVYHVCNREFFARDELARQFLRAMGLKAAVENRPQASFGFAEPRPLKSYLDSTRFAARTGMHFTSVSSMLDNFRGRLHAP